MYVCMLHGLGAAERSGKGDTALLGLNSREHQRLPARVGGWFVLLGGAPSRSNATPPGAVHTCIHTYIRSTAARKGEKRCARSHHTVTILPVDHLCRACTTAVFHMADSPQGRLAIAHTARPAPRLGAQIYCSCDIVFGSFGGRKRVSAIGDRADEDVQ